MHTDPELDHKAARAIAHFMLGMMKADGRISRAEENQSLNLLFHFQDVLPGQVALIKAQVEALRAEALHTSWTAQQHLKEGLSSFDTFLAEGGLSTGYTLVLRELLRLLMEVDGIEPEEIAFIQKLESELVSRYSSH